MTFTEQDVVIASGASALVALARKKWPAVDGGWVWVAMFVAAAGLYGLFEVLPLLHPTAARIAGGALAVIAVVTGGKGVLSQLAGAAQQKLGQPPTAPEVQLPEVVIGGDDVEPAPPTPQTHGGTL